MPVSYKSGKKEVRAYLLNKFFNGGTILDAGPGVGTYYNLLNDRYTLDCCEIHKPYIDQYELSAKYRQCWNEDIRKFEANCTSFANYDIVIIGDVLEHLPVVDAQLLLEQMKAAKEVIVAVPFQMHQGAIGGVESERHHQPDLTPELFVERYSGFKPLYLMPRRGLGIGKSVYSYGYYIKS